MWQNIVDIHCSQSNEKNLIDRQISLKNRASSFHLLLRSYCLEDTEKMNNINAVSLKKKSATVLDAPMISPPSVIYSKLYSKNILYPIFSVGLNDKLREYVIKQRTRLRT